VGGVGLVCACLRACVAEVGAERGAEVGAECGAEVFCDTFQRHKIGGRRAGSSRPSRTSLPSAACLVLCICKQLPRLPEQVHGAP
jgi:hypothetical protein